MPDQDLGRALGRLEQQVDTASADITDLSKRSERADERIGRVERSVHTARTEIGSLNILARVNTETAAAHDKRLKALEEPIEQAKATASSRQTRMRNRVKQIGAALVAIFTIVEWVGKPIVGYLADQWVRGIHPPGH